MTVTRFCEVAGIPRPTWYRWQQAGSASKGPWPAPAQDAVEADAKALAAAWEGWGHRKLAELKRVGAGGVSPGPVSDSTMHRVLARNGLSLPANYAGEIRRLAGARKEAFVSPPSRRNRLRSCEPAALVVLFVLGVCVRRCLLFGGHRRTPA